MPPHDPERLTAPPDPEELEASHSPVHGALPAESRMGTVHLTVADLERSLDYYTRAIGLSILERSHGQARLGTGARELLRLVERPGARPARGHTGLYHFALLVPRRFDLARWLAHAIRDRVALVGLSDHFVSEALYLSDPDEHGIEIYWDRPRELWEGQVASRMTTLPLDVQDLLGELEVPGGLDNPPDQPYAGLPSETAMGHVHLKVADVAPTLRFYRDVIGFGLMAQLGPRAVFLSAGGYHHHLGANTWESAGASPPPPDAAALRHATLVLPDPRAREELLGRLEASGQPLERRGEVTLTRDPSGNALALAVA